MTLNKKTIFFLIIGIILQAVNEYLYRSDPLHKHLIVSPHLLLIWALIGLVGFKSLKYMYLIMNIFLLIGISIYLLH
jgi:hypothetical protein